MENYIKEFDGLTVPTGAAYYNPYYKMFFNKDKTSKFLMKGGRWSNTINNKIAAKAEELPKMEITKWMPEIGKKCEILASSGWVECLIIGNDAEGKTVVQILHGDGNEEYGIYTDYGNIEFRPIKSEKEKYRDHFYSKAIDSISELGFTSFEMSAVGIAISKLSELGFKAPKEVE